MRQGEEEGKETLSKTMAKTTSTDRGGHLHLQALQAHSCHPQPTNFLLELIQFRLLS